MRSVSMTRVRSYPDVSIKVGLALVYSKSAFLIDEEKSVMLLQPVEPAPGSDNDGLTLSLRLV